MSRIVETILLLIGYETTRQQIERARTLFPFIDLILFFPLFFFHSYRVVVLAKDGSVCECIDVVRISKSVGKNGHEKLETSEFDTVL